MVHNTRFQECSKNGERLSFYFIIESIISDKPLSSRIIHLKSPRKSISRAAGRANLASYNTIILLMYNDSIFGLILGVVELLIGVGS